MTRLKRKNNFQEHSVRMVLTSTTRLVYEIADIDATQTCVRDRLTTQTCSGPTFRGGHPHIIQPQVCNIFTVVVSSHLPKGFPETGTVVYVRRRLGPRRRRAVDDWMLE